ncbi:HPr family phosphocarrier protein [Eubacteriaceae bacterium ES3]|nr:HPr family phosphocarrier protein [Eubacteriaceae bacterium ES3]
MSVIVDKVVIQNKAGLHAKPASLFVQRANDFKSEIYIKKEATRVNAKSIMGVMILAVQKGDEIEIEAVGDDEMKAVEALKEMIENRFDFVDEM